MKNIHLWAWLAVFLPFGLMSCSTTKSQEKIAHSKEQVDLSGLTKAYFASGCFWCVEAVYESVKGVAEAVSGYAGGSSLNPTYQAIGTGKTGHAETVEVYYDAEVVSFETLLTVFFGSGDPTTLNRQGPDRGTQYRSIIFYQNDAEKLAIEKKIAELEEAQVFNKPIVTEVKTFEKFYAAEDYHQDYERLNPHNPYVKSVSIPRLKKFQKQFPDLLQ